MHRRIEDDWWAAELGESRVGVVTPPTPLEGDEGKNG
jgi:hypothetical protein